MFGVKDILTCRFKILMLGVICCTIQRVFHHISKNREASGKYDAQRSIFDELRGVWKCDETLSGVFDISARSKLKL